MRSLRRPQTGARLGIKRAIDVLGAALGLVVLAPLMAAVAVAIRIDSPGPAVFRQERVGRNGEPFVVLKFRSMRSDADPAVHRAFLHAVHELRHASVFKAAQDEQITRVGHYIRKLSIDEIPQLWNVLVGDMSLVGPRPEVPYALDTYEDRHWRRFDVLPGITGLWQVSGRNLLTPAEMLDLDVEYVDSWSVAGDIHLLARTVPTLLHPNRAA